MESVVNVDLEDFRNLSHEYALILDQQLKIKVKLVTFCTAVSFTEVIY